jgi:hypothetical protein
VDIDRRLSSETAPSSELGRLADRDHERLPSPAVLQGCNTRKRSEPNRREAAVAIEGYTSPIRRARYYGPGLVLALGLLAAPLVGEGQPPGKIYRIGVLITGSASVSAKRTEALRQRLRDLGYVEGTNIALEYRWGEGKQDRLPELAAELVRGKVDVIVTHGAGGRAAKRATTTIPIVVAIVADPIGTGLVASLARPGGNVTGLSIVSTE